MEAVFSSYKDPSGSLFTEGSELYRRINWNYENHYRKLMDSGLYDALVNKGWLIPHEEVEVSGDAYRQLKPERLNLVSYPHEWSFSQMKEAALLTLKIATLAIEFGMTLKDATAFNVQFIGKRAVFIDTLSFEIYQENQPWQAYRQFCQHFLAPLLLRARIDLRLSDQSLSHINGVPLDLVSKLLPKRTWLSPSIFAHIHLHALAQAKYSDQNASGREAPKPNVSKLGLQGILSNLTQLVKKLKRPVAKTEWGDYYRNTNYSNAGFAAKKTIVLDFLSATGLEQPSVLDLGANNGEFSRALAQHAREVVSADVDPVAVDENFRICGKLEIANILPLVIDICNPSPAFGWRNRERESFLERVNTDVTVCLALVHHLAIGNNLPMAMIAELFARLSPWLIIEFVPKSDSQVQRLLHSREDIFKDYRQDSFECAFNDHFETLDIRRAGDSERTLYLFRKRESTSQRTN